MAQMGRVMITVPILERWSKQKTVCALTAMLLGYSEYLRYPFEVLVAQIPGMALCSNLSQPILLETSKNLNTKNKDLTFSCMLSGGRKPLPCIVRRICIVERAKRQR